jgi:hypothetical protein
VERWRQLYAHRTPIAVTHRIGCAVLLAFANAGQAVKSQQHKKKHLYQKSVFSIRRFAILGEPP